MIPKKEKTSLMDRSILNQLQTFVSDNYYLLSTSPEYKPLYNLLCAVTDRLTTAVDYINSNSNYPENEQQLILFIAYSCMVYDAVGILKQKTLNIKYKDPTTHYFKKICMSAPLSLSENECLTDEEFFEHFRSLSFAHPYETSRRKSIKDKFGVQYSPIISVDHIGYPSHICVMIYSEKTPDTQLLHFDFDILKDYIKYRYSKLTEIIDWFNEKIEIMRSKVSTINVSSNTIEMLNEALRVLGERYINFDGRIEMLIDFLKYENIFEENKRISDKYKGAIESMVPQICKYINEMDYESANKLIDDITCQNNNKLQEYDYCYSKISDSYNDDSGTIWELHKPFVDSWIMVSHIPIKVDVNTFDILDYYYLFNALRYDLAHKD